MAESPKVFISYSWTSPDHFEWVHTLAKDLEANGVHVLFDRWNLEPGKDKYTFMEQMVTDESVTKVVLVCDREYKRKANLREGGVGDETQIITPKLYQDTDQNKFAAVLSEKDENGQPYLPAYIEPRIYIDMSDADQYVSKLDELLRWIYNKPQYPRPERGRPPEWANAEPRFSLGTDLAYRTAMDAVRNGRHTARGVIEQYFKTYAANLERLRITDPVVPKIDELIIESIESHTPFRDQAVELFLTLAQYRQFQETYQLLHDFFARLLYYAMEESASDSQMPWRIDNFKFVVHELFLYCIAALIKHECFDGVGYLLRTDYYIDVCARDRYNGMEPFTEFYNSVASVIVRDKRRTSQSISPHGALINDRATITSITFDELMQADLLLYIRYCTDALRKTPLSNWWPVTLAFAERRDRAFPIFAKATSKAYFQRLSASLDITGRTDIDAVIEAFDRGQLREPVFSGGWPVAIRPLMNYDALATRP